MKLDLFPCLARDRKSPPQRRIVANIFGKEVDLHWRKVCSTNSVFIIRSKKIYSRAFIQVIAQHFIAKGSNVIRNLQQSCLQEGELSAEIGRHSFSVSLNFYQTILESSPQTRFMFDIKKLLLIDALTLIYSPRNTGRPVENCNRFAWIASNSQSRSHYWLQESRKYRCRVGPATLRYSTTQFLIVSLCCVSLWHEINLLRCSFS